jgi:RNA polymerase sigma factor (sigma-70 family)
MDSEKQWNSSLLGDHDRVDAWEGRMERRRLDGAVHCLRALVRADDGPSDGDLLERFVRTRDASAFAVLVQRHGPMVLAVCRRVLRSTQDAEDAFQATFLVLVRRAATVRPPGAVGGWLHGVARRTALDARRAEARRRAREARTARNSEYAPLPDPDLREVLDVELAALPEKHRALLVLCDVEGKSRKEAARMLRLPEGTVASRLARARALLGRRLARRGLPWSAAGLALALGRGATAAVPRLLAGSTIEAVGLFAMGRATGVVAPRVVALMEGAQKTMGTLKYHFMALLLAVGVMGGGTAWLARPTASADAPQAKAPEAPKPPPKVEKVRGRLSAYQYVIDKVFPNAGDVDVHVQDAEKFSGRTIQYGFTTSKGTQLLIDGKPAKLEDFPVGLRVRLTIDRSKATRPGELGEVTRIEASGVEMAGWLQEVNARDHTLTIGMQRPAPKNYEEYALDVADDARIVVDEKPDKLAALTPGMNVHLKLSAVRPAVVEVTTDPRIFSGDVEDVDLTKDAIILTTNRSEGPRRGPGLGLPREVFPLRPDIRVTIDGKKSEFSDLKRGMKVQVSLSANSKRDRIIAIEVVR